MNIQALPILSRAKLLSEQAVTTRQAGMCFAVLGIYLPARATRSGKRSVFG